MSVGFSAFELPALSRVGVDRAAHRRDDEAWLAGAWSAPGTRVLLVGESCVPVRDAESEGLALVWVAPSQLQTPDAPRLFLGEAAGTGYFAVAAAGDALDAVATAAGGRVEPLRMVGSLLSDAEAGLAVHAVGLANWHQTHPRCPRCGEFTVVEQAGHSRRCPADGSVHFPRTDPAVIMLVHDGAERALLGRAATWPEGRFSTLAGFVESGEAAEAAVVREVAEEVGIPVTDVTYRASQPWPFPSSLMLGFRARALSADIRLADGELAEARWFTRDGFRAAIETGEVLAPMPASIAYQLITHWLAEG